MWKLFLGTNGSARGALPTSVFNLSVLSENLTGGLLNEDTVEKVTKCVYSFIKCHGCIEEADNWKCNLLYFRGLDISEVSESMGFGNVLWAQNLARPIFRNLFQFAKFRSSQKLSRLQYPGDPRARSYISE